MFPSIRAPNQFFSVSSVKRWHCERFTLQVSNLSMNLWTFYYMNRSQCHLLTDIENNSSVVQRVSIKVTSKISVFTYCFAFQKPVYFGILRVTWSRCHQSKKVPFENKFCTWVCLNPDLFASFDHYFQKSREEKPVPILK